MNNLGDTELSRKNFYERKSNNLIMLLKNRYSWMNNHIEPHHKGIEVGAGTGISKDFINNKNFQITDYCDKDWLDIKNIDALNTGFADNSFDFVISSNMIHHISSPVKFLEEMSRILKPGGKLIIQEINCSIITRLILILMNHEGYNFDLNIFDRNIICTDPNDLWSGNNAIPNLLFDDKTKFHTHISFFRIDFRTYDEFLCFLNSGGVISKTFYIPLPKFAIKIMQYFDKALTNLLPNIFAMQTQIILVNTKKS
jgi:SAM-dependent methyltransferase